MIIIDVTRIYFTGDCRPVGGISVLDIIYLLEYVDIRG
jgi:hypothetical protein